MSRIDVSEILTKGVPNKLPAWITIPFEDIKKICKNTKDIDEQLYDGRMKFFDLAYDSYKFDVRKYIKYDIETTVGISQGNLTSDLFITLNNVTASLFFYLGLNLNPKYSDVEQKIKVLESIATEEELKENFPEIYSNYLKEKRSNSAYYQLKKEYAKYSHKERLRRSKEIIKTSGIDCDPFVFLELIDMSVKDFAFPKYLMNMKYECKTIFEKILENISAPSLSLTIDEKDKELFEMYIVASFLKMTLEVKLDKQQNYIYYLSSFFMKNKDKVDKDKKIAIPGFEKAISYNDLYKMYQDILIHNPNLQIIDLQREDFNGMTLDEVDEFMDEYIRDLTASWEFFKDDRVDSEILNKINEHYQGLLKTEEGRKKFDDIIEKYIDKKNFFDNSDPYYRILGKGTFAGYIGYLYKNGKVVFEKFFDNPKTGRLAKEQAIYIMNIDEFCELTYLSKKEIRKDRLCAFVHHQGDWKGRVKKHIEEETDISPVEEIEKLKKAKVLEIKDN